MDIEAVEIKAFSPSHGLTASEAAILLEEWGRNELEEKKKSNVMSYLSQSILRLSTLTFSFYNALTSTVSDYT